MATQPNIISDISTLTRVPNKALTELSHKANLCIGNIISDARDAGEQAVIIWQRKTVPRHLRPERLFGTNPMLL